ncbi:MAG: DUF2335 domain-containing protein [Phycisphaerae bacterium]
MTISAELAMHQQSGPIPPPEVLKGYDQIHPGLAHQIVTMAAEEAAHRRRMEVEVLAIQKEDQAAFRKSERKGQIFGLIVALAGIFGSVYEAVNGAQLAAGCLSSGTLVALVAVFIGGRWGIVKLREQDHRHQTESRRQMLGGEPPK